MKTTRSTIIQKENKEFDWSIVLLTTLTPFVKHPFMSKKEKLFPHMRINEIKKKENLNIIISTPWHRKK